MLTLINSFHGTRIKVRMTRAEMEKYEEDARNDTIQPYAGRRAKQTIYRIRRRLCGIKGCECARNCWGERYTFEERTIFLGEATMKRLAWSPYKTSVIDFVRRHPGCSKWDVARYCTYNPHRCPSKQYYIVNTAIRNGWVTAELLGNRYRLTVV